MGHLRPPPEMIFSSALVVGRSDHHIRPLNFTLAQGACLNDVSMGSGGKANDVTKLSQTDCENALNIPKLG